MLRAGTARELNAREVVPGDIVLLEAGDRVPADLRVLAQRNLEVDESILTGESLPVAKTTALCAVETELAARNNIAHAGTMITRGTGHGVAVATGMQTQLGQISALLGEVRRISTPLLTKLAAFSRTLTVMILVLASLVGLFGVVVHALPAEGMLMVAVSIAVAAIPEGLPPVITITLAIGVQIMARHNAIVRRLPAVETLGEVNVVCTDKTGTLTRNEMTVRTVVMADGEASVTGAGYEPVGAVTWQGGQSADTVGEPARERFMMCAVNCNDADLYLRDGAWAVSGDPTEGALIALAAKAGLDTTDCRAAWPRVDVIPFESEQRFMASMHADGEGAATVFAKGAPERIVGMCSGQRRSSGDLVPIDRAWWLERAGGLADTGQRVLALACLEFDVAPPHLAIDTIDQRLTMLGLVGIADPPRPEVKGAIERCSSAGISVKMITGDHLGTAAAIGAELGLDEPGNALSGHALHELDAKAFDEKVAAVSVFARAEPDHKLRIVSSLQQRGEVVAMTGDGVNDAPALKRADIGIAMGVKGTQVAREAADVVLADDNFATIVRAVEQGRVIYDNIRKSIVFLLPTSMAEALIIAVAVIMGAEPPMTPVQILWVNMITAVTLGIALAFEPGEPGVMQRHPRRLREPILTPLVIWRTLFVAILMLAGVAASYLLAGQHTIEYARTVAVTTLVGFEAVYLFSSRRLHATVLGRGFFSGNIAVPISVCGVLVFQLLFTYQPGMSTLFDSRPLGVDSWLLVAGLSLCLLLAVEAEKAIRTAVCQAKAS